MNCAVLSEGLIESELFDHEKGAFPGAVERVPGVFERANRGAVFLDEIGELPPAAQAKLLRVIEQRKLRRLGGTQWISVDVRIVAATNRNLEATVAAGKFREDLFHRLNVARLQTIPLRERVCDIPALVRHFIERLAAENDSPGRGLSEAAEAKLVAYHWPGNVRELRNVMERAVVMASSEINHSR